MHLFDIWLIVLGKNLQNVRINEGTDLILQEQT